MKKYYMYSLLLLTLACKTEPKDVATEQIETSQTEILPQDHPVIGERIRGTVSVSTDPNGTPVFELYDNALVEAAPEKSGLVQVMVYVDLQPDEFELTNLEKGRYLMVAGDTIGRVLKTVEVSTGQGESTFGMLFGYTAKGNIKSETVIENSLLQQLESKKRDLSSWQDFIKNFELSPEAFDSKNFETYYNYENSIEDPSPGFRVVLLFEAKKLVGFVHSRPLELEGFTTYPLDRGYEVSFFADFSQKQQKDFVRDMNTWLEGVD